jgi:hypothetical protein
LAAPRFAGGSLLGVACESTPASFSTPPQQVSTSKQIVMVPQVIGMVQGLLGGAVCSSGRHIGMWRLTHTSEQNSALQLGQKSRLWSRLLHPMQCVVGGAGLGSSSTRDGVACIAESGWKYLWHRGHSTLSDGSTSTGA